MSVFTAPYYSLIPQKMQLGGDTTWLWSEQAYLGVGRTGLLRCGVLPHAAHRLPLIPASCEPKRILKYPCSPQYSLRTVGETKARVPFNTKTRVTFDTKARVKFKTKARVKFKTKARVKFKTKARVKFNTKARQGMSSPWLT